MENKLCYAASKVIFTRPDRDFPALNASCDARLPYRLAFCLDLRSSIGLLNAAYRRKYTESLKQYPFGAPTGTLKEPQKARSYSEFDPFRAARFNPGMLFLRFLRDFSLDPLWIPVFSWILAPAPRLASWPAPVPQISCTSLYKDSR